MNCYWVITHNNPSVKLSNGNSVVNIISYANRRGVEINTFRFMLDGERITPEQTPKFLELEENGKN